LSAIEILQLQKEGKDPYDEEKKKDEGEILYLTAEEIRELRLKKKKRRRKRKIIRSAIYIGVTLTAFIVAYYLLSKYGGKSIISSKLSDGSIKEEEGSATPSTAPEDKKDDNNVDNKQNENKTDNQKKDVNNANKTDDKTDKNGDDKKQ